MKFKHYLSRFNLKKRFISQKDKLSIIHFLIVLNYRIKGGTQQISSKLIDYVLANSDTDTSFSKVLLNTVLVEISRLQT